MLTRLRKTLYRARGHVDGQLGGERFRLDPYHSKFWRRASAGNWEPETFAVLRDHLHPDRDYLDIGAWIGPTVLFGARRARHVYCFEPDPVAFRHLAWNIELNGLRNVSAFAVALSNRFGVARMASFGGEAGDSMTSLLNAGGDQGMDVVTVSWDDFAASVDLSAVSLVKMDIEGAEFDVLPALIPWLQAQRPALYLSTHAPFLEADTRAERMATLFDMLSFYGSCRDEAGQPVTRAALDDPRYLERFPSFLFSD
ncbi:FkbM family methyltransferase [Seohaeicola saemankumensis]|nr:FkbM family methyltransferase [Seohaeicola saemankumensis]MCA0872340.1 FkbM family methyltransferase [Seohaeicola saemankumensis]